MAAALVLAAALALLPAASPSAGAQEAQQNGLPFPMPWFAPPAPAPAPAPAKAPKHTRPAPKPKREAKPAAAPKTETAKGAPAPTEAGKAANAKADPAAPATATPEAPPPPYEPQVLRLAEILGALAYLDDLCGAKDDWRKKMQDFLEAEARSEDRKERLAGAFNRSFHDYEQSYQACSPNAQIVISRFLSEGGKLARDVANRFSAS
ncbi:TIGR02301 family protein [Methylocella silvestris]|uniref:TIGR02301 family protein n=1 Tax=Methylocella silvestris TaxID=199596 RepID=UPI0003044BA2|nr:TIGR02301 family protein [Methylocella silvestris]